jgi:uridine kinase
MTRPYLIGIAGPSCAGKSFLAERIARELGASILHIDAYYRELDHYTLEQRATFNFDAPEAIETELLLHHVEELACGHAIERPVYNFSTHTRERQTVRLEPAQYVIIDGIFALFWPELRQLAGTKVYVNLGENKCLRRRKVRDVRERGRTEESVLRQFEKTVQPMAKLYVYPTRQFADIVVTGDHDIEEEAEQVLSHIRAATHVKTEG